MNDREFGAVQLSWLFLLGVNVIVLHSTQMVRCLLSVHTCARLGQWWWRLVSLAGQPAVFLLRGVDAVCFDSAVSNDLPANELRSTVYTVRFVVRTTCSQQMSYGSAFLLQTRLLVLYCPILRRVLGNSPPGRCFFHAICVIWAVCVLEHGRCHACRLCIISTKLKGMLEFVLDHLLTFSRCGLL